VSAIIWQVGLLLFLMAVNATLAGSEVALISLRETQIERLGRRGRAGRALSHLAQDPNRFLATVQVGITLAGFLASATAAITLAEPLVPYLGFFGNAAEAVAVIGVTLLLTVLMLVFGELVPKRMAMQASEAWALRAALPLSILAKVSNPLVRLLSAATNLAVRLLGGNPALTRQAITEEEIKDLVSAHASYSPHERRIISGALEFGERTLREVLQPRRLVTTLEAALPASAALDQLMASGHSRAPVVEGDLDRVIGVVHLRDLIGGTGPVGGLAKSPLFAPETANVLDALRTMQRERQQFLVVINEHGGAEGIVTAEDLVEELVGELWDETDPDVVGVVREADGSMVMSGRFPFHDLQDLGVDLPEGDYSTVAGLILDRIGRLPANDDRVEVAGWSIEILAVERRAIQRVRLRPPSGSEQPAG
jgi:putative hemolysin